MLDNWFSFTIREDAFGHVTQHATDPPWQSQDEGVTSMMSSVYPRVSAWGRTSRSWSRSTSRQNTVLCSPAPPRWSGLVVVQVASYAIWLAERTLRVFYTFCYTWWQPIGDKMKWSWNYLQRYNLNTQAGRTRSSAPRNHFWFFFDLFCYAMIGCFLSWWQRRASNVSKWFCRPVEPITMYYPRHRDLLIQPDAKS